MALLGEVELTVVYSEKPERSVKVTDHPVETGESVADHAEVQPYILNLTGVVTGEDAWNKLQKLQEYSDNVTILSYSHRNSVENVIIEMFNTVHDATVAGAFTFTMRLKRIRTALVTPVDDLVLPAKVQVKGVGNKGLQQGMTPAQMAAANNNHVKS